MPKNCTQIKWTYLFDKLVLKFNIYVAAFVTKNAGQVQVKGKVLTLYNRDHRALVVASNENQYLNDWQNNVHMHLKYKF